MILKDKLKHIWTYRHRTWANKAIDDWCELARSIQQTIGARLLPVTSAVLSLMPRSCRRVQGPEAGFRIRS